MKGLELAEKYYKEYGETMLYEQFADIKNLLAVGLVGSGSECFGFDDDISTDHDFEPGFCIFIPDEDIIDSKTRFRLERAYAKLPKEFCEYKKSGITPTGGSRHGVICISEFYGERVGSADGNLTAEQWLTLPQHFLAEATNGKVFYDGCGAFTDIREKLVNMPEDVRKKRIAGNLLIMAQAGQYNYMRCINHGEGAAAQLAVIEFCKAAMQTVFLLNKRYMPYYKWSFKAMRGLKKFSSLAETLEFLITTDNGTSLFEAKYAIIEDIAGLIITELQDQGLTKAVCGDLEKHAYSVNDSINDGYIRNLNVLYCV